MVVSKTMMRGLHWERQSSDERWRRGVCLALVALLLYNPFLAILSSSDEISVQHPLSYRATVASSELRRCTTDSAKPLPPELTAALFCAAIFLRAGDEIVLVPVRSAVAPMSLTTCDSVWFRPPPST
jgi:hypothetical protein